MKDNNGLCDGFYAVNTTLLNGFAGVNQNMNNGFQTAELDVYKRQHLKLPGPAAVLFGGKSLLDYLHPVGSIYQSTDPTSQMCIRDRCK